MIGKGGGGTDKMQGGGWKLDAAKEDEVSVRALGHHGQPTEGIREEGDPCEPDGEQKGRALEVLVHECVQGSGRISKTITTTRTTDGGGRRRRRR